MLDVIILAAGKGTRMRSDLPKVLHSLGAKPFIQHVIDSARALSATRIFVVVGHGADAVKAGCSGEDLHFVEQREQRGTGHAVQEVLPHLSAGRRVLILYGDVPLTPADTLNSLVSEVSDRSLALLTVSMDDPAGYGRVVRDSSGEVSAIVEHKDATSEELEIRECNSGILAANSEDLQRWLPQLQDDNAQGEFLLPDIFSMARDEGWQIATREAVSPIDVMGVNNRRQQAELERHYQRRLAEVLMDDGVSLRDPNRFDCRGELKTGRDCEIDVNCVFEGQVRLGDRVKIGAHCIVRNCVIADDSEIHPHSVLDGATLGREVNVGPFARLRPEARLADGARVGNFVEIKKASIGAGSKVNHLSYVGDAEVGNGVNIGAGTITCNYDGANKFTTRLGDGVFVGSNTALVAPVSVGSGATIGAGSVITADVAEGNLAVARARQRALPDWERPKKKK